MKVGLLWYDDDPGRDLAEKIGRAAQRYRRKFGAPPNVCYVHPSAISSLTSNGGNGEAASTSPRQVGGLHVASLPSVLQHHFWLGQEDLTQQ
jgi:hypothetical protein